MVQPFTFQVKDKRPPKSHTDGSKAARLARRALSLGDCGLRPWGALRGRAPLAT